MWTEVQVFWTLQDNKKKPLLSLSRSLCRWAGLAGCQSRPSCSVIGPAAPGWAVPAEPHGCLLGAAVVFSLLRPPVETQLHHHHLHLHLKELSGRNGSLKVFGPVKKKD